MLLYCVELLQRYSKTTTSWPVMAGDSFPRIEQDSSPDDVKGIAQQRPDVVQYTVIQEKGSGQDERDTKDERYLILGASEKRWWKGQKEQMLALMTEMIARKDRVLLMWCIAAQIDVKTTTETTEGSAAAGLHTGDGPAKLLECNIIPTRNVTEPETSTTDKVPE